MPSSRIGSQQESFRGGLTLAKSHIDGVTLRPSVVFDGVEIERDGSYVHPAIRPLEERLLSPQPAR